jgi:site-specific recombinase XerD
MNFAQGIVYNDQARDAVQRLVPVAQSAGLSLPTLALTFFRRGLRHSAASLMLAQGTPLHVVSEVRNHHAT